MTSFFYVVSIACYLIHCYAAILLHDDFNCCNGLWCHYSVCLTGSWRVCYKTNAVHELPSPLVTLAVVTDMHHRTELSFVDEFRWVSPLRYLENGCQNAVLLWCMLQAGPSSLHYYCAVVLHSCTVLPPVCHSSNHQYHCCQLTDNQAVFLIVIALLRLSFDSSSYISHKIIPLFKQVCDILKDGPV